MMNAKTLFTTLMLSLMSAAADPQVVKSIYDANKNIGQWINPNAFMGIVIMIVFFWVCNCVFGALAQVQTPRIMLEKTLDFGKIEKVEE